MRINIDPKKELFKWGPIEFRLIYGSLFLDAILFRIAECYSWRLPPSLLILSKGTLIFIIENLKLQKVGLKYFKKYFLNLKNYKTHWKKWEKWVREYDKLDRKFKNIKWKNVSDKDFHRYVSDFYSFNIKFWFIVLVPEVANWGGEYLLKNKLDKLYKDKSDEYLEILAAPVKLSFFQQEELDLLKISYIKNKNKSGEALRKHAEKYHWIMNSYGGNRVLSVLYFENRLKELTRNKSAKLLISEIKATINAYRRRKKQLIKKLKLNKKTVLVAEQLSQSIWWQDFRKGYIWRLNHHWDVFLREIARRTKWRFNDLQWCYAYELLNILRNGRKADKKEIKKRKKYYLLYVEEENTNDTANINFVKKSIDKYVDVKIGNVRKIKGQVVSKGNGQKTVKGRARIIANPFKDGKRMKRGDILVAGMTSPEFIVVMRKAKAIITDHGGITCHAAIVSRELKIPCIVNTKIATKALRDGDLVEVDVDRGIVKILN